MHNQMTPRNSQPGASGFAQNQNLACQVMSSREIADLVEARHNDVIATIERLFEKGLLRSARKTRREPTGGRPVDVYDLCERGTHLVVAGYSDEHRARVIDRWQQLEEQMVGQLAIPTNFADALRLAAEQVEQNQQLQAVIAKQAPKVAAIQRLASAQGAVCLNEAAKLLQINPRRFVEWLLNRDWLYRSGNRGRLAAKQTRIDQGFMSHKITELAPDEVTGQARAVPQPLVTPKGLTRLAVMFQEAQ